MATNPPTGKAHPSGVARERSQRKLTVPRKIKRGYPSGELIAPKKNFGKMGMRPLLEAVRWRVQLAELGLNRTADFEVWVAATPENRAAWRR